MPKRKLTLDYYFMTGVKLFLVGMLTSIVMSIPLAIITMPGLMMPMFAVIAYVVWLFFYFIVFAFFVVRWKKWIFGR